MNYTLRCWQRLGDILLCLPAAKYLQAQGHSVRIECIEKYHAIFRCVDYVTPVAPSTGQPGGRLLLMAIHPNGGGTLGRYLEYRRSGLRWQDYVYGQIEELRDCPRGAPLFTHLSHAMPQEYGLPEKFILSSPHGYSQLQKHSEVLMADKLKAKFPGLPLYTLTDTPAKSPRFITAKSLEHLPQIIGWATGFASINSAPAIIAAGLGRAYLHFPQVGDVAQDDVAYLNPLAEVAV